MLWDPKKEKQFVIEQNPLSLDALIAWLEKKPAGRKYCYTSIGHCLFAQYFTDAGFKNVICGPGLVQHEHSKVVVFPRGWAEVAVEHPRTFGAALARARELKNAGAS